VQLESHQRDGPRYQRDYRGEQPRGFRFVDCHRRLGMSTADALGGDERFQFVIANLGNSGWIIRRWGDQSVPIRRGRAGRQVPDETLPGAGPPAFSSCQVFAMMTTHLFPNIRASRWARGRISSLR
jgi:hypothetical protein